MVNKYGHDIEKTTKDFFSNKPPAVIWKDLLKYLNDSLIPHTTKKVFLLGGTSPHSTTWAVWTVNNILRCLSCHNGVTLAPTQYQLLQTWNVLLSFDDLSANNNSSLLNWAMKHRKLVRRISSLSFAITCSYNKSQF